MASVEFRSGGLGGAYRRRVGDYAYDSAREAQDGAGAAGSAGGAGLGGRLGRVVNYVAAVVSVGLVVGLGVWGVRLVSRDVSGVPVIRAMVGEARIAPADPGGERTSHTGLAVNAVQAGKAAPPPADQVVLAPAGAGLVDEDLPMGALGATATEPGALSDSIPLADAIDPAIALQDSEIAAQRAEAEAAARAAEAEAAAAVTRDAPASETIANEAVTGLDGALVDAADISAALAEANATGQQPVPTAPPASPGALAQSSRPAARPARPVRAAAVAPAPVTAAAAPAPAPAPAAARPASAPAPAPAAAPAPQQAAVAAGAAVVQIGAFDSDAIARSEWTRVSGKAGGLFNGKGQIVQRHESNGRVFYRLRVAGFGSTAEAQKFCGELKALGTDCIAMKVN